VAQVGRNLARYDLLHDSHRLYSTLSGGPYPRNSSQWPNFFSFSARVFIFTRSLRPSWCDFAESFEGGFEVFDGHGYFQRFIVAQKRFPTPFSPPAPPFPLAYPRYLLSLRSFLLAPDLVACRGGVLFEWLFSYSIVFSIVPNVWISRLIVEGFIEEKIWQKHRVRRYEVEEALTHRQVIRLRHRKEPLRSVVIGAT